MPDMPNPNDDPNVKAALANVEELVNSLTAEEIIGEAQCFGANLVEQLTDEPVIRLGVGTLVRMIARLDSDIEGHVGDHALKGTCLHNVDDKPIVGETLNGVIAAMARWQREHRITPPGAGGYL